MLIPRFAAIVVTMAIFSASCSSTSNDSVPRAKEKSVVKVAEETTCKRLEAEQNLTFDSRPANLAQATAGGIFIDASDGSLEDYSAGEVKFWASVFDDIQATASARLAKHIAVWTNALHTIADTGSSQSIDNPEWRAAGTYFIDACMKIRPLA